MEFHWISMKHGRGGAHARSRWDFLVMNILKGICSLILYIIWKIISKKIYTSQKFPTAGSPWCPTEQNPLKSSEFHWFLDSLCVNNIVLFEEIYVYIQYLSCFWWRFEETLWNFGRNKKIHDLLDLASSMAAAQKK